MNRFLPAIFFLVAAFLFTNSWAAVPAWSPVMTLGVGNEWAAAGETQRFYLQPDVEKKYVADRKTNTLLGAELFIGAEHRLTDSLIGQIGIAIAKSSHADLHGDVWEDADPDFNNYTYAYKINHSHIAIKGVLLTPIQYGLLPYVSASLGVGFNQAYHFTVTPKIEEETPPPGFENRTQTAFTYTVGVGVRKAINKNWQVGVGYEFADWGRSQLAPAPEQTVNTGLKLDHLYTQGVFLNLTYSLYPANDLAQGVR